MKKQKMNEEKARKYLRRKGKPETKEEIEKVQKEGKIYGDPIANVR